MRAQITMYSDDTKRFEKPREEVADLGDGYQPARSELVRMTMDQFDPEAVIGTGQQQRQW